MVFTGGPTPDVPAGTPGFGISGRWVLWRLTREQ